MGKSTVIGPNYDLAERLAHLLLSRASAISLIKMGRYREALDILEDNPPAGEPGGPARIPDNADALGSSRRNGAKHAGSVGYTGAWTMSEITMREAEICQLLYRGETVGQVGYLLGINNSTIHSLTAMMRKRLGLADRNAVLQWAHDIGAFAALDDLRQ